MKKETFETAKVLNKKIQDLEFAQDAFEWNYHDDGTKENTKISRNPKLIIECDDEDGGRELIVIPGELSKSLMNQIKNHIADQLKETEVEFEKLKD